MDSTNIPPQVQSQFKTQGFSNPQGPNMPQVFPVQPMGGQFAMGGLNRQYPPNQFMPQPGTMPQMIPFPPEGQMRFAQSSSALIASAQRGEKKNQFSKGVYVSGFEKTLTTAMLHEYFSKVKGIKGIKLPMNKLGENKGFAFIYFESEDDANYVKKKLDRTVILRSPIRVTKTVISDNLSKMMFKMKVHGLSQAQIEKREKQFFNEEKLEEEIGKIINEKFGNTIQLNKIIIPVNKKTKKTLKYARVFFYISDLNNASNIVRRLETVPPKNGYETVLAYIANTLNQNELFNKFATAQIYEYTKRNLANVLHLKGIKRNPDEDALSLSEQLKNFIQQKNPQWNIVNCFSFYSDKGAWANVTFGTWDETLNAFETIKANRPKFRDSPIYGSIKNVKDYRTVVISVVKEGVTEQDVTKFLNKLATSSPLLAEDKGRKYDYFGFNIIEHKTFFLDNEGNSVSATPSETKEKIGQSWRELNEVPRRVVVHFLNQINQQNLRDLTNDMRTTDGFKDIFFEGDNRKFTFKANHQKGHIKDNHYVLHLQRKPKVSKKPQTKGPYQKNPRADITGKKPEMRSKPFDKAIRLTNPVNPFNPDSKNPQIGGGHSYRPGQPGKMPTQRFVPNLANQGNMRPGMIGGMGQGTTPNIGQGNNLGGNVGNINQGGMGSIGQGTIGGMGGMGGIGGMGGMGGMGVMGQAGKPMIGQPPMMQGMGKPMNFMNMQQKMGDQQPKPDQRQ